MVRLRVRARGSSPKTARACTPSSASPSAQPSAATALGEPASFLGEVASIGASGVPGEGEG
jgi:hypothetical protein